MTRVSGGKSDAGCIEGQLSVSNSKMPGGGMRREVEESEETEWGKRSHRMAGRKARGWKKRRRQ